MTQRRRDQTLIETIDLLRRSGATGITVTRNRHHKIRFRFRNQNRTIVVSTSPSTRDASKTARSTVKRVLRSTEGRRAL
jgi:hypothetical protein